MGKPEYKTRVYVVVGGGRSFISHARGSVDARFDLMQSCSPVDLELVYSTPGGQMLEAELRDALSDSHAREGWYDVELTTAQVEQMVEDCKDTASLTSVTGRNMLKSRVWADCEEIQKPSTSLVDARHAWERAVEEITRFEAAAKTASQRALALSLRGELEAASKERKRIAAATKPQAGIEPVPPPEH